MGIMISQHMTVTEGGYGTLHKLHTGGRKFLLLNNVGLRKILSVLEAFMFFDQHIIDHIVAETKGYADYCIQNSVLEPRSCIRSWQPLTSDKIYVVLGLTMLMDIVQKPTLKLYFSTNAFIETLIFPHTMTSDRFELIMKFLHFVDDNTVDTYTGRNKIFKVRSLLEILRKHFQSTYLPAQDLGADNPLHYGRVVQVANSTFH
jgi:hypothetical protein